MNKYNPSQDVVSGRTAKQIESAKSRATGGKRKRCVKGKSCGASCINGSRVCMVDLPWVSAGLSNVSSNLGRKPKSISPEATQTKHRKESFFQGSTLVIDGKSFTPGKTLPGSTHPVLYVDSKGEGKWVVKGGGAAGQNVAEGAANRVYNILSSKLGSGAVESKEVEGKLVNKFISDGKTINNLTAKEMSDLRVNDRIRKSLVADALVANWDFMGMVKDNIMADSSGTLRRIDSGGTFDYRAMGSSKKFGAIPMEMWTLRTGQGKNIWANPSESDYRNLWTKQTSSVASESKRLREAVNSSNLKESVKKAFSQRVSTLEMANKAITTHKLGGKSILELADSGKISWGEIDSAMKRAFNASESIDLNSKEWSKKVFSNIVNELSRLI